MSISDLQGNVFWGSELCGRGSHTASLFKWYSPTFEGHSILIKHTARNQIISERNPVLSVSLASFNTRAPVAWSLSYLFHLLFRLSGVHTTLRVSKQHALHSRDGKENMDYVHKDKECSGQLSRISRTAYPLCGKDRCCMPLHPASH